MNILSRSLTRRDFCHSKHSFRGKVVDSRLENGYLTDSGNGSHTGLKKEFTNSKMAKGTFHRGS